MTAEEIKQQYSMADIIRRYGFQPNRSGFIPCPFHNERTASMKIYKDSFYCFGCGTNGDIFTFVQFMDNLTFKESFYALGGTYEHLSGNERRHAIRDAENTRRAREKEAERKAEIRRTILPEITRKIDLYRNGIKAFEPLSDEWCYCMNEFEKELYRYECVQEEVR